MSLSLKSLKIYYTGFRVPTSSICNSVIINMAKILLEGFHSTKYFCLRGFQSGDLIQIKVEPRIFFSGRAKTIFLIESGE